MKLLKARIQHEMKEHLVDTMAMVGTNLPLHSSIELLSGMTNEVSMMSRAYSVGLTYLGLGRVIKIRDYTKKKFHIDEYHPIVGAVHDIAYSLAFGPLAKAGIYLLSGETDWKKIGLGVVGTTGITSLLTSISIPIGGTVDINRECWGIRASPRTPEWLKKKSSTVKRAVSIGMLATSLVATAGIYSWHYHLEQQPNYHPSSLEKVIEKNN